MIALGTEMKMKKPVDSTMLIALTLISHYVVHVDVLFALVDAYLGAEMKLTLIAAMDDHT